MLNKVKSEDVPKDAPDKLQCNHQTEIYYKRMMAIALAALAFLLTGEFQVAAVVLLALKCCQKIYAETMQTIESSATRGGVNFKEERNQEGDGGDRDEAESISGEI